MPARAVPLATCLALAAVAALAGAASPHPIGTVPVRTPAAHAPASAEPLDVGPLGRKLPPVPAAAPAAGYALPTAGLVWRLFERPSAPWGRGHRGVDIMAEAGAPVRAPADGVVTFSGVVVDRGVLTLRHADGLRSSLEPLDDLPEEGTLVTLGEVVGAVADLTGAGHCGATACVHWGVRDGEAYVDPLGLLDPGPVVLLPP